MRRYFALLILLLTACLPVSTLSALPTPSVTPHPSIITPSPAPPAALVRIDPVLYTYWISGPEILELASEVHATDLATGEQTLLFNAPEASTYMPIRNVVSAAWSPGGERVLVSFSNFTDSGGSLRLITADGNRTTPLLAEHPSMLEYALWSPNGQHIVMRRVRPQPCLMIAKLDDATLRELAPCDPLEYPRFWSTDGEWIAIYRLSGTNTTAGNWFAVAVDGGERVALEQLQGVEWYDQRYRPWRITSKFACTWATDPQRAKQFSFWRCE
jgi:dipeptidyl aminopeptidase/acylaminoacyl peptidase